MATGDYADKAREMRQRAEGARTDSLRALYLQSAESYESLARRPGGALAADHRRQTSEAASAEIEDLKQRVVALENALTISLSLLRRQVPGLAQALSQVNVEPHPSTTADRKASLQALAARIRRILGQAPAAAEERTEPANSD